MNGAGKSSILGAFLEARGGSYYNPDRETRVILKADSTLSVEAANTLAWQKGRDLLERAIAERLDWNFETTLGGRSISALLEDALSLGSAVEVFYVGLDTAERHIARVRERVTAGGHDIDDDLIRSRFVTSREHLVQLAPWLTALHVFENSEEVDLARGEAPKPRLVIESRAGQIARIVPLVDVPDWAKPVVAALMLS